MTTQSNESISSMYYEDTTQERALILGLANSFLSSTLTAREALALFEAIANSPEYLQILPGCFEGYMSMLSFKGICELGVAQDTVSPLTGSEHRTYKQLSQALAAHEAGIVFESPLPFTAGTIGDIPLLSAALREKEVKNFVDLTGGSLQQTMNLTRLELKGSVEEKRRTKFINDTALVFEPRPFNYGLLKLFTRLHPELLFDLLILLCRALGLSNRAMLTGESSADRARELKQLNQARLVELGRILEERLTQLPALEAGLLELEAPLGNLHKRHTLTQRKPIEDLYIELAITYLLRLIQARYISKEGKLLSEGASPKLQLDFLLFAYRMFESAQRLIHNPRRLQDRPYLEQKVRQALSEYPSTPPTQELTEAYEYFYLLAEPQEEYSNQCFLELSKIPELALHSFTCEDKRSPISIFELKSHSYFFYADITTLETPAERFELLQYLDKLELNGFYFLLTATITENDAETAPLNEWLKAKPARFKLAQLTSTSSSMNICLTNYSFNGGISIKELWKS